MGQIAMTIVAVLAGAWLMPSVLDHTALAVRAIGEHSAPYAPLVISPWGLGGLDAHRPRSSVADRRAAPAGERRPRCPRC